MNGQLDAQLPNFNYKKAISLYIQILEYQIPNKEMSVMMVAV